MNTETKRHIDAARQVLVGVVPNPTAQIDQITNALIYKFMDDMDQAAIKQGDEPSFFVGSLEPYAWTRLMDPRMGNQERMNLYGEALVKFSEAKQLPDLFRGIFRSAFLPYRSPETLGLFLKEIAYFDYSHPEELGNAYEYLLSIMSSQGDAGQFRTPRHIIDFIVDVVNPTKDDKVLDPACGTGGFLVSSYKHILEQHDGKDDPEKAEKPLTPDERRNLMTNFEGYDIDPTMARIAQVNMYLHQFKNPKIFQYDTLSSDERWGDKYDVILANPPFMSPKGGIKPHSKFSIQSSRSEVLFVDYIMTHLRPKGRAGIIVPEGIIFQSGTAHKQLRKNLVEDGLYAVVSLPSGVFAPYSGVKTSILLFDNELAKARQEIVFVKVEQDGFDLGATKRPISKNDLPTVLQILDQWRKGEKVENKLAVYVEKSKISENGDYNLSGDRYRTATDYSGAKWPMVELGDKLYFQIESGGTPDSKNKEYWNGKIKWVTLVDLPAQNWITEIEKTERTITELGLKKSSAKLLPENSILVSSRATIGRIGIAKIPLATNQGFKNIVIKDFSKVNPVYIANVLTQKIEEMQQLGTGGTYKEISKTAFSKIKIPLPPVEIQEQVVAQIDGFQKVIDGVSLAASAWKPRIEVDPEWKKVKLGEVCDLAQGFAVNAKTNHALKSDGDMPLLRIKDLIHNTWEQKVDSNLVPKSTIVSEDDILYTRTGQIGLVFTGRSGVLHNNSFKILYHKSKLTKKYLYYFLMSEDIRNRILEMSSRSAQPDVTHGVFKSIEIPLPPLAVQKQIVERIEFERGKIEGARELVPIYKERIRSAIAKLWTE